MCYRPLKIRNTTLHFNRMYSSYWLYCACGKCLQCKSVRQRDWLIRAFAEWRNCVDKGGIGVFYTLTYDEEHIPYSFGYYHFSRRDIQTFVKRVKEYYRLQGFEFRYLITCEYGDMFERSHMHALFFLIPMRQNVRLPMLVDIRNIIFEKWQNGFVYPGKFLGRIQSTSALQYVTKYVTKDVGFDYAPFFFRSVLHYARKWVSLYGYTHKSIRDWYNYVRNFSKGAFSYDFYLEWKNHYESYLPFVSSSTQFGMSLLDSPYLDKDRERVVVPSQDGFKETPLPLYLTRKLFFDRVPNERDGKCTKYVLNFEGIRHRMANISSDIDRTTQQLSEFFRCYIPTYEDIDALKIHFPDFFRNEGDLLSFLRSIKLDPHYIAIYKHVFRGRSLLYFKDCFHFNGKPDYDTIFNSWQKFYERCLTFRGFNFDNSLKDWSSRRLKFHEAKLFSARDPLFASCEMYLNLFEILHNFHAKQTSLQIDRLQDIRREIRLRHKKDEYNQKFQSYVIKKS